jgi:hypothetical protein
MYSGKLLTAKVALGAFLLTAAWSSGAAVSASKSGIPRRGEPEIALQAVPRIEPKFIRVPHADASEGCEVTRLPEPLTTPNPMLDFAGSEKSLSVDFVVGIDGLVHSAFLLKSAGEKQDQLILDVVRSWRYRPAMCNGVPTEAEATVDFSNHRSSFGLK